jgi:sugar-specific transcriptional regulator TrmB
LFQPFYNYEDTTNIYIGVVIYYDDMITQNLIALGLSKNEAITYLELCKLEQSTGGNLIKITGFHRNIVYDNLEKLINKGLISYIIENNRKIFIASPPDALKDFIEEEQKRINTQKKIATDIIKKITPLIGHGNNTHNAIIIRGTHALKQELKQIFNQKTNYISFGGPDRSTRIMGVHYWKNFSQKVIETKIRGRLIFNESLRDWAKIVKTKQQEIRFFEKEFEPLTQTIIYGITTLIIVWVDKPITTIIRSQEVSTSYKHYFEVLWKESKK